MSDELYKNGNSEDPESVDASGNTSYGRSYQAKPYGQMPTTRYASEYNMNNPKRGFALIFNHEVFDIPQLKARAGTNVDCENLYQTLKNLHFDVSIHKDYRLSDIQEEIKKVAEDDHTYNDCILIAILSHGEYGYLYSKDTHYKLESLTYYFTADRCPSLAGKPKLFFIQACQGDKLDGGFRMKGKDATETDSSGSVSFTIPIHADFLIAYSTIPGYYSWRNTTKGSWFMQSLCHELNENGKKYDLLTLLTFVCQRVAYDFESNTPDTPTMHQQKQIPCITTMMTRLLTFRDKV